MIESLHNYCDLMPTLLEYLGVKNTEAQALPGRSFAGILYGEPVDPA